MVPMCLEDGSNDFTNSMKLLCYFTVHYYWRYFPHDFTKKNKMHCRRNGFRIENNLVEVNMPLVELINRYYGVKLSVTLCQRTTVAETKESRNAVISLRTLMTHILRTEERVICILPGPRALSFSSCSLKTKKENTGFKNFFLVCL